MILNRRKLEIDIAKTGMKKGEFVEKAGIHWSTLTNALKGKNVSAATANKIAKALGEDLERYIDIYI